MINIIKNVYLNIARHSWEYLDDSKKILEHYRKSQLHFVRLWYFDMSISSLRILVSWMVEIKFYLLNLICY